HYNSAYNLVTRMTGAKAYKILADALKEKGRIGLAKVSIREKQHMATVRVKDGVIVMETMYWPEEIRAAEFEELEADVEVRKEEVDMAAMSIDNLTKEFDPSEWVDRTREAVEELASKKVAGEEVVVPESPEPTKVVALPEGLRAPGESRKERRKAKKAGGPGRSDAQVSVLPPPIPTPLNGGTRSRSSRVPSSTSPATTICGSSQVFL